MLRMAPLLFWDAEWQARILAEAKCAMEVTRTFGRPDLARSILEQALDLARHTMKKRLPPVPVTRNPKINQFTIHTALRKFFPKFKETGELPSQRQFAKAIGVTPKAWRSFSC